LQNKALELCGEPRKPEHLVFELARRSLVDFQSAQKIGQSRRRYKENHISLFPAYIRNPAIIKRHGHLHRQQNVGAYQV
jgi:hypothetical protein